MPKTLFEKMSLKPNYSLGVINMPSELAHLLQSPQEHHTTHVGAYNFILAFYIKQENLEKDIMQLKNSLIPGGLLWIAYPKNKALETDLHRDILRNLLERYSLETVALVALDNTWSAMRVKLLVNVSAKKKIKKKKA